MTYIVDTLMAVVSYEPKGAVNWLAEIRMSYELCRTTLAWNERCKGHQSMSATMTRKDPLAALTVAMSASRRLNAHKTSQHSHQVAPKRRGKVSYRARGRAGPETDRQFRSDSPDMRRRSSSPVLLWRGARNPRELEVSVRVKEPHRYYLGLWDYYPEILIVERRQGC